MAYGGRGPHGTRWMVLNPAEFMQWMFHRFDLWTCVSMLQASAFMEYFSLRDPLSPTSLIRVIYLCHAARFVLIVEN